MKQPESLNTISTGDGPIAHVTLDSKTPLPPPFDKIEEEPPMAPLSESAHERFVVLDDTVCVGIPLPKDKLEEQKTEIRGVQYQLQKKKQEWEKAHGGLKKIALNP